MGHVPEKIMVIYWKETPRSAWFMVDYGKYIHTYIYLSLSLVNAGSINIHKPTKIIGRHHLSPKSTGEKHGFPGINMNIFLGDSLGLGVFRNLQS